MTQSDVIPPEKTLDYSSQIEELDKKIFELQELLKEKQEAESQYYQKTSDYIDFQMLPVENEENGLQQDEILVELKNLVENTSPSPEQKQIETAVYYGNLSLILVVMGILPVYVAYRLIKSVVSLTNHIL